MDYTIKKIKAREILDSRGNPTVEADILTTFGIARAAVPSGASTGVHEALELRDGGKRFGGKGVLKAVDNVNKVIAKKLVGADCREQEKIDKIMLELDGTDNKSGLGANAILAVSMACCKAGAVLQDIPLYQWLKELSKNKKYVMPVPCMNVINGGVHAGNKLDVQEFMLFPVGAKSFSQALQFGAEVYHTLKSTIKKKYGINAVNVGDEGGFAPPVAKIDEPMGLLLDAIDRAGHKGKVEIGIDAAASEFFKNGKYFLEGKKLSTAQLASRYEELVKKYPLVSIEDPFCEEDFEDFALLNKKIGKKVQIVGDDLLVTNPKRVKKAIGNKACNALLLKVNQIGSITEAIEAARLAQSDGWGVMVSHRSGETEDSFIADLVVGLGTGEIKSGAPCRSERLAKYNQLLRIEEELGNQAKYAGKNFRKP
ncbi:phosphopyruvate hydratase [Candidatus Woesearchaeota archaeon]|nr:phosphopyruvate hydratase [Candidatus Woesearchaeota archaeon]